MMKLRLARRGSGLHAGSSRTPQSRPGPTVWFSPKLCARLYGIGRSGNSGGLGSGPVVGSLPQVLPLTPDLYRVSLHRKLRF